MKLRMVTRRRLAVVVGSYPGTPGETRIICPLCGAPILSYMDPPDPYRADARIATHMLNIHRARYRLWQRLGWRWLITGFRR